LRKLGGYSDPLIERYFGRVAVARLEPDLVAGLTRRVSAAIVFWRKKLSAADTGVEQIRLFVEILSRLCARRSSSEARSDFLFAFDLARDPALRHHWLFEQFGNLLERSLRAVLPTERASLILESFTFPLPEDRVFRAQDWPSPFNCLFSLGVVPNRDTEETTWADQVRQLIEKVRSHGAVRNEAILRLAYLSYHNVLLADEMDAFGKALWTATDDGVPPLPDTGGLTPHILAMLPAPEGIDPVGAARDRLFSPTSLTQDSGYLWRVTVASRGHGGHQPLLPTRSEAVTILDGILTWQTEPSDEAQAADWLSRPGRDRSRILAGQVLAHAVVPQLVTEDFTAERIMGLMALPETVDASSALGALVYIVGIDGGYTAEVTLRIRRSTFGRNLYEVMGGIAAIETWVRMEQEGRAPPISEQLVQRVISAIEARKQPGLQAFLACARRLVEAGKLGIEETDQLTEALGDAMIATSYDAIELDSVEAVSISLVRAECVKLANALEETGRQSSTTKSWLKAALIDPLPEVRFALAVTSFQ
jgi:hypothetical protein